MRTGKGTAFVLSGGGSRGALEAGALLVLFESGIRPQILVGSSVGAINAAAVARNPTLEGARELANEWRQAKKRHVLSASYLNMAWHVITRQDSLLDNTNLKSFIKKEGLREIVRFSDIKQASLYIGATRLDTGQFHVFGINRSDSVLDAIMASTARVPFLPPWEYKGHQYIDAAFTSDLPIKIALQADATDVFAIDVGIRRLKKAKIEGMFHILEQVLTAESYGHFLGDITYGKKLHSGSFHYISIPQFEHVQMWDFDSCSQMVDVGMQTMSKYLDKHHLHRAELETSAI
jgi:NTE family protein